MTRSRSVAIFGYQRCWRNTYFRSLHRLLADSLPRRATSSDREPRLTIEYSQRSNATRSVTKYRRSRGHFANNVAAPFHQPLVRVCTTSSLRGRGGQAQVDVQIGSAHRILNKAIAMF